MSEVEKQSENTAPAEQNAAPAEAKAAPEQSAAPAEAKAAPEQNAAPAEEKAAPEQSAAPAAADDREKAKTKIRIIVELAVLVVALVAMCIVGEVKKLTWWCYLRASLGSATMSYNLAMNYRDSDPAKYKLWLEKAANRGHIGALRELAESDPAWMLKLAEKGDKKAMLRLAQHYRNEKKDVKEAIKWYEKAAEKGLADAQHELGVCYLDGTGVKKDLDKAEEWLKKAHASGCARSEALIARVGESRERQKKIKQLLPGAEKGDVKVQYELACLYKEEGEKADAFKWYEKAAQSGHLDAMFWLSYCYSQGEGVNMDPDKAEALLKEAAAKGHKASIAALEESERERANEARAAKKTKKPKKTKKNK